MKKITLFLVVLSLFVLPLVAAQGRHTAPRSSAHRSSVHRSAPARHHVVRHHSRNYHSSYYGGGYGYSYGGYYGRSRYYLPATGIRLNMELISKDDRDVVRRGIVTIDGSEQGIVDRYDGWQNGCIPVAAGGHLISVELEDGRVFQTNVLVQPGQSLHVYIRFGPLKK